MGVPVRIEHAHSACCCVGFDGFAIDTGFPQKQVTMALASLPSPTDSLQLQTFRQRSDLLNDLDENTIRWLARHAYCANLINFAEKEKIVDNRGSGESKTLFTRSVKNAMPVTQTITPSLLMFCERNQR